MGNTHIQRQSSDAKLPDLSVRGQMLRFIDNFDSDYQLKFDHKFARENTNDRGEVLSLKFVRMVKEDLATYFSFVHQYFEENEIQAKSYFSDGDDCAPVEPAEQGEFSYLEVPFYPPPLIHRMWDLYLLYSVSYRHFCLTFFKGILLSRSTSSDPNSQEIYDKFISSSPQLHAFLWPKAPPSSGSPYSLTPMLSLEKKLDFIDFVNASCKDVILSDEDDSNAKQGQTNHLSVSFSFDSNSDGQIHKIAQQLAEQWIEKQKIDIGSEQEQMEDFESVQVDQSKLDQIKDVEVVENLHEVVEEKLEYLKNLTLPASSKADLQHICMLSDKMTEQYIMEYKKYLLLSLCAPFKVTPGHKVDYAWHVHLMANHMYPKQMALFVPAERLFRYDHGPTQGTKDDRVMHRDQYKKTLLLYTHIFGKSVPYNIWEKVEERFYKSHFCTSYVDLRRVAAYHIALKMHKQKLGKVEDGMSQVTAVEKSSPKIEEEEPFSIIQLATSPKQNFIQPNASVQQNYINLCLKYQHTFSYGGPCYVSDPDDDRSYSLQNICKSSGESGNDRILQQQLFDELSEIDRRNKEASWMSREYTSKVKPGMGSTQLVLTFQYNKLNQVVEDQLEEINKRQKLN